MPFSCFSCCVTGELLQGYSFKIKAFCGAHTWQSIICVCESEDVRPPDVASFVHLSADRGRESDTHTVTAQRKIISINRTM